MSRTYRNTRYRRVHNKEEKLWRKIHYRKFRAKTRVALYYRKEMPRFRRTSGWLSY